MARVLWTVDGRVYPARVRTRDGRTVAVFADGTSCVAVKCSKRGRAQYVGLTDDLALFEALLSRARAARRREAAPSGR